MDGREGRGGSAPAWHGPLQTGVERNSPSWPAPVQGRIRILITCNCAASEHTRSATKSTGVQLNSIGGGRAPLPLVTARLRWRAPPPPLPPPVPAVRWPRRSKRRGPSPASQGTGQLGWRRQAGIVDMCPRSAAHAGQSSLTAASPCSTGRLHAPWAWQRGGSFGPSCRTCKQAKRARRAPVRVDRTACSAWRHIAGAGRWPRSKRQSWPRRPAALPPAGQEKSPSQGTPQGCPAAPHQ